MRLVIYGAGGIGGVLGGRLFEHGHEVVLIARGRHYQEIAANGLRLESPDGSSTLAVAVVDHPGRADLRADDVVVLGMKSHDTFAALHELAATAPAGIAVVCAQNGVENERAALRLFDNVYGLCVMCPTSYLRPGVVQAYSSPTTGILDVGRYPSGADGVAGALAAALSSSTFSSEPLDDITRWKYAKLLMNLANAVEALCGPAARDSDLARLARQEGEACLQAAGIDFASEDEDRARRGDWLKLRPIRG